MSESSAIDAACASFWGLGWKHDPALAPHAARAASMQEAIDAYLSAREFTERPETGNMFPETGPNFPPATNHELCEHLQQSITYLSRVAEGHDDRFMLGAMKAALGFIAGLQIDLARTVDGRGDPLPIRSLIGSVEAIGISAFGAALRGEWDQVEEHLLESASYALTIITELHRRRAAGVEPGAGK